MVSGLAQSIRKGAWNLKTEALVGIRIVKLGFYYMYDVGCKVVWSFCAIGTALAPLLASPGPFGKKTVPSTFMDCLIILGPSNRLSACNQCLGQLTVPMALVAST